MVPVAGDDGHCIITRDKGYHAMLPRKKRNVGTEVCGLTYFQKDDEKRKQNRSQQMIHFENKKGNAKKKTRTHHVRVE